jgi:hypothetical protein
LRERELTYESERSSIFNENVSVVDTSKRNNIKQQYSKGVGVEKGNSKSGMKIRLIE